MKYYVGVACIVVIFVATFFVAQKYEMINIPLKGTLLARDNVVKVLFVGDIMMGRNVENLSKSDPNYPFLKTKDLFSENDFVVANLEGPIMEKNIPTKGDSLKFSFASTSAVVLANNGISLVSLANNHLYDYGSVGYAETVKYLGSVGVKYAGHPFAFGEEYSSNLEKNGQKISFLAYNFTNPKFSTSTAIDEVKKVKAGANDYLVVLIHGGTEYKTKSSKREQGFYRSLIDAGADAIVGHHPHVAQEIEEYKGKPISYSLGNFIFDQYFSKDVEKGLALSLVLSDTLAKYEVIEIQSKTSQPYPVVGKNNEVKTFIR